MKRFVFFKGFVFTFLMLLSTIAFAQKKVINNSELPATIQNFIRSNFPNQTVSKSEIEIERNKTEYEVALNDGTELEFDSKYNITKIKRKMALPESVVPKRISDYVKSNYPNANIIEWELDNKRQEVKLSVGIELDFNLKDDFLRVDY